MERSKRNREKLEYWILKEWKTETLFGMVNEMMISDAKRGENYGSKIRITYIWNSYLYENEIR